MATPSTSPAARADLAARLYDVSLLTGSFKLRSGGTSDRYFDKYLFEADPALLGEVVDVLATLVPDETEALAGLEMGGIALAVRLSDRTGLPLAFVRKQAKPYGTCKQVEGASLTDRRVLIVEDVVTKGGAIVDALGPLRASGAEIIGAVCAIDREAGAEATLAAESVPLTWAFSMSELESAGGGRDA
jgi:orotate phosphoribosyltransferase